MVFLEALWKEWNMKFLATRFWHPKHWSAYNWRSLVAMTLWWTHFLGIWPTRPGLTVGRITCGTRTSRYIFHRYIIIIYIYMYVDIYVGLCRYVIIYMSIPHDFPPYFTYCWFSTNVQSMFSCPKKLPTKVTSLPHFPEILPHQFSQEFSQSPRWLQLISTQNE